MSQFSLDNLPEIPEEARSSSRPFELGGNYLVSTFVQMGLGLSLTALTAFLFLVCGGTYFMYSHPMLALVLMIAQIGIALSFSFSMNKASVGTLRLMFFAYSVLTGVTFSSLGIVYTGSTLFYAFAISAVYYFCLAFVGATTNKKESQQPGHDLPGWAGGYAPGRSGSDAVWCAAQYPAVFHHRHAAVYRHYHVGCLAHETDHGKCAARFHDEAEMDCLFRFGALPGFY